MRGLQRSDMETAAVLVQGDPAAGKTTFAKQLLSDIMREERKEQLVPTMIRVIDLDRAREEVEELEAKLKQRLDLVTAYLMLNSSEAQFELFMRAQREQRLVVILDGMDEAQQDEKRLEKEIHEIYVHKFHLVLTSRFMGRRFETSEFERFRKVRVLELNPKQQQEVVEQRLRFPHQIESRERFLNQIDTNSALSEMAKNPLLLNLVGLVEISSEPASRLPD